jgi:uncharacterized protein (TIGR00369 family)
VRNLIGSDNGKSDIKQLKDYYSTYDNISHDVRTISDDNITPSDAPLPQLCVDEETNYVISSSNKTQSKLGGVDAEVFEDWIENASIFGKDVLGVKTVLLKPGRVSLHLPYKSKFIGNVSIPAYHGGVHAALMDHCGNFCARSVIMGTNEGNKYHMMTVHIRVDYLKPALDTDMVCDAEIAHHGSTLVRVNMTCWNHNRTTKVAIGRALYRIIRCPMHSPTA